LIAAWISGILGKILVPGKFTKLDVLTISARLTWIGSGISFASGRMITIFPECKTTDLPRDPFRDKRKLPSSTRTFMYRLGRYSIIIVVPVRAAVTAAV
jgi:hypothetical protein